MWSLICASILFLLQHSHAAPFNLDLELIPEVDQCANVQCPQLSCQNTVLKQGSCCRNCVTIEHFCLKDGLPYMEDSIVPSNSTDACEVCHCCEGKVVCGNVSESCPQLACDKSRQVKDAGKCCARCDNAPSTQPQETCTENEIVYQEGDVWNPYFSKFGVVKCQICTCKNGTTSCETVPCPPVRACTPDDPVEEITACCPKCNRSLSEQNSSSVNRTSTYSAPTLFPEKPTESNVTCPLVYSFKVYKTIDPKVDQIAIEHINFSYVDVYVWSPAFKSVKYEPYSSKSFAEKHINTRFRYIGDATAESVKTVGDWFMVKKKKLSLYYCKRNCSPRVIKLLQPCK